MNKFDDFQISSGEIFAFRFEAAGVLAKSLAKSGPKLPDVKLIAWLDRIPPAMASFLFESSSGSNGRNDDGVSHAGQPEMNVDDNEMICRAGGMI